MRWNRFSVVLAIAAVAVLALATPGHADIVTPTGATSTTWIGSGDRTIAHTIDGSGLSGGGTSGDILSETHSPNNANTGTYWLSASGAPSGGEVLEFTIPKSDITAIHHWVYTRNGETDRGLKTFDISFSTDNGATFPTTITAATLGDFIGPPPVADLLPQTKTFALQTGVTDIRLSNLVNFGDPNYIGLSEIRFDGTTASGPQALLLLEEGFSGAAGTQPPGWQAFTGSDLLLSQNDGNGEYEQRKVQSPAGSPDMIASYADENDIAQGKWRDVTLTVKTRFSGSPNNDNGVIFRAADIDSASGSGDFYHARVNGSQLELYRFVNGSATLLAEEPLSGFNPFSYSNWYRVSAQNIPSLGTDDVHIVAELFKDAALTDLAGRIEYVDAADNAVTRAGGVGFRSENSAGVSRSVFDDLTVVSDNPALLWYDDYFDGDAPHMTAYGGKPQNISTADKYQFQGGSGEGIAFIDLPEVTSQPEWADVDVRAVMRMSDDGTHAGGLISRVTGVEDPGAGNNTSTGDMYMYRLQRSGTDRAQLYRRNNGSFTLLAESPLGFDIPVDTAVPNWNIFLKMLTFDVGDEVHIWGQASLYPDFHDVFGDIYFRDTSADRILGPGSAGFRVYGGGTLNFDNFTVSTAVIPEPSTLALMALAAIGLAAFARRRKRRTR